MRLIAFGVRTKANQLIIAVSHVLQSDTFLHIVFTNKGSSPPLLTAGGMSAALPRWDVCCPSQVGCLLPFPGGMSAALPRWDVCCPSQVGCLLPFPGGMSADLPHTGGGMPHIH